MGVVVADRPLVTVVAIAEAPMVAIGGTVGWIGVLVVTLTSVAVGDGLTASVGALVAVL